jgi:hypothetical protein
LAPSIPRPVREDTLRAIEGSPDHSQSAWRKRSNYHPGDRAITFKSDRQADNLLATGALDREKGRTVEGVVTCRRADREAMGV